MPFLNQRRTFLKGQIIILILILARRMMRADCLDNGRMDG